MPIIARVNAHSNGLPRSILNFEENKKGDVYIRIKSGDQASLDKTKNSITEHRYSIHPSPSSAFTTLKAIISNDGIPFKTVRQFTDAVKSRSGFAHLFTHRAGLLIGPLYDTKPNNAAILDFGEIDFRENALIFSVLIGHPNTPFLAKDLTGVMSFCTSHFKFIVFGLTVNIPASSHSWTISPFTINPDIYEDESSKLQAQDRMRGLSADDCMETADFCSDLLVKNLMNIHESGGIL